MARFDLLEDLVDGRERQVANRMAKVFERGRLGKCARGAEVADLQWFLLGEAGGHDLAKQPHHFLVA